MTIPRLRLIDKPSEGGKSDKIEIIVQYEDETLNYTADYFPSPVDQKFREKLHWYFKDYLVHPYGKNQQLGRVFPSEINKIGRLMGDQLFGEDYPLFTQIGKLDEIGMEQVIVTLESERAEFFDEPWELLLLPDTERALAASCAGFIRTRYKDPEPAAAMKLEAENKLRILMVMPWPENQGTLNSYSNASLIMNGFFEYEQSIDVEILKTASREGLEKRLADKELPVHIVYFCGFAGYDAAAAALSAGYLIFEDSKDGEERVSTDSAAQLLKENGVSILFLDLHQSPVPDEAPVENTMNTSIALELMQYGLEGVVTMSHASYTFSTSEYFRTIFSQIAGGKSLGQAVAESRKFMLNECSQDTLTSQKTDFYDWPLALHYGQYDISVFPQPLEPVPLVQTRSYSNVRNTVIGFKNEMLPPNLFLGRDKEFHHIENTFHRNSIILLYGSQGIGKTHLAHQYAYWFAAADKGDKAFYFNFENESFDREEILKLTGHVLDQEKATKEKTYEQFISKNFLLVIDNFMPEKNDEKLPAEKLEKLLSFFKEIAESGSRVLIISSSITESGLGDSSLINNITPILLPGLGIEDRRHLASVLLKTEQIEERGSGPEFYELLDSLQGHPFLTITLLLWLAKTDAQSIKEGIEQKAKIDGSSSSFLSLYTPEILFDFSWDKLSEIEQLFFAALADCSGFITDGLPIAFDMKDEKKKEEQENASTIKYPGQEFFELLGVEVPEATTGLITAGVRAGFLMAKPMGKEIHSAAPAYLANKRAGLSWPNDKLEKIKLLLNKIFCLELRVLAPFLARNPNPILYQQVGENHKRWFDALETVWLNKDFTLFMNSSHLLASIMHKIGMKEHLDEWYLKLIKSSTLPEPGSSLSPEASVAWLKTACDSIHARGALDSPEILKGVEFWHHWIDNDMAGYENAEYKKIIFNNIVMFLEAFYRVKKEWEGRKNISLIALNFYEEEKDYLKVITSLQSIARCYEALGSLDECKRYEEKVMNDIPYDSLDDGIKEKSMLEIAINRINRKEYSEAESLLNAVKDSSQIGELLVAADSFQGRIFMEQDRLEEAVAIFTDIWRDIMERKHQFNIESTSKNLVDLENKMGKEKFRAIFEENAPGVLTPLELVMQQQGGAPQPPEGA